MPDLTVQRHLLDVAATLRREAPPLPAARRRNRAAALDALEAYARAGRFPRPEGPVGARARRVAPPRAFAGAGARAPIFEDRAGTRCAVGHLLGLTRPDLVARIRDADNGVFLPELHFPALDRWARDNGFTRDELAWIQPSYCWEVPVCDEVVLEAPPAHEQQCSGPDASLQGASYWYTDCQECDGPYKVWAWVTNAGTETATGVTVELRSVQGALATITDVTVPVGEVVQVGPLETGSVRDLVDGGWIRVTAPGDCWGDWDELESWGTMNGGPGYVEPEECGGEGCLDSGPTFDSGGDPADDTGNPAATACGCAEGAGTAAGVLLGIGIVAVGARRRAD